ncbi:MAG: type IV toxin-antitoxin system AbiEi family antitoxin [Candidatus Woesearchaeota archaeon]
MKEIDIIEKLNGKAVFSVQDVQRIGGFPKQYAALVLGRLKKRGLIRRITKNAYTVKKDILVIASNLKIPSYISFWSASAHYGFTEQALNTVYVACTRKVREIGFEGHKIRFVKVREFFGYEKVRGENGDMFIATQEKLLIDSLLHFREMGNFDEIEKVFQKASITKEKIVECLKKAENLSLVKRAGYLLEKHKNMDISAHFKMDRNYVFLNQFSGKYRSLDFKWMVKL